LTLHERVTAPGQNIGAKGQQEAFDLFGRPRVGEILRYLASHPDEVSPALDYLAWRFKRSYEASVAPPSLADIVFNFVHCVKLSEQLIAEVSGGHFPQLLIAALLKALHEQNWTGLSVSTHHAHASDYYTGTAGDIDITDDSGTIVEAFEVTARPDWKNRTPDFPKKMQRHNLSRFTILCLKNNDPELNSPEALEAYVSPLGYDVAVVDIKSFAEALFALLTHESRTKAFTYFLDYVEDRKICGVPALIDRAREILT
jgi:hypothetical protein